ncbi:MAG: hypothetical protein P8176_14765 [Gammaproteobacteria bacterium]
MMAQTGRITWVQAAEQASEARNLIMEVIRTRSTPVGLSIAQKMKKQGKTLNEIVAIKSQKLCVATLHITQKRSPQHVPMSKALAINSKEE